MRNLFGLLLLALFILQGCSLFAELPEFAGESELDTGAIDADDVTEVDSGDDVSDADSDTADDVDTGVQEPMAAVDILWTIDNTGGMCSSQAAIRNGMEQFAEAIAEVDFHIAVTTTQMIETTNEPVAKPGQFQSTPQPLPGFSKECHHPRDENGELIIDDLSPVVEAIWLAVDCTEDPDQWLALLPPNEDDLGCALDFTCDEFDQVDDFFPDPDSYRTIPSVLRARDYTNDGLVDVEALKADLLCATHVGSRGYGFEQGLAAAVKALSPEMTGGLDAAPGPFPNAGFLRETATTAVIFISTENDCSHDGNLNETSLCSDNRCTIEENLGADGALLAVDDLREDFMRNIALSKEWDIDENTTLTELEDLFGDSLFAASIHGAFQLANDITPDECDGDLSIEPSCDETRMAWSGHRYSEFISGFPAFYPTPEGSSNYSDIPGLICGDFASRFTEIATLLTQ